MFSYLLRITGTKSHIFLFSKLAWTGIGSYCPSSSHCARHHYSGFGHATGLWLMRITVVIHLSCAECLSYICRINVFFKIEYLWFTYIQMPWGKYEDTCYFIPFWAKNFLLESREKPWTEERRILLLWLVNSCVSSGGSMLQKRLGSFSVCPWTVACYGMHKPSLTNPTDCKAGLNK